MQDNRRGARNGEAQLREDSSEENVITLMELLFFAYRDFISDPDAILAEIGFGRAHHRIIHFIGRNPGLRVSELLGILRITKQSLGRVLRDLIDRGYVYQEEGPADRRQRLLYLTGAGRELHGRLSAPQIRRISRALRRSGPEAGRAFARVLAEMADPEERERVEKLTGWRSGDG